MYVPTVRPRCFPGGYRQQALPGHFGADRIGGRGPEPRAAPLGWAADGPKTRYIEVDNRENYGI